MALSRSGWCLMALLLAGLASSLPADNTMSSSSSVSTSFSSSSVQTSASSSVSTADKKPLVKTTTTTGAPVEAEAPVVDVVELDKQQEKQQPDYKAPGTDPLPEPEPKPETDLQDLQKPEVMQPVDETPVKPVRDHEATVIQEVDNNIHEAAETRDASGSAPSMTSITTLLLSAVVALRMLA